MNKKDKKVINKCYFIFKTLKFDENFWVYYLKWEFVAQKIIENWENLKIVIEYEQILLFVRSNK